MKISFTQIYAEVGTSFGLSGALLTVLAKRLNGLKKDIPSLREKRGWKDFTIVLIITATRKSDELQVKGPLWLRKTPVVEFAVHIPYREFACLEEQVAYVLHQLGQGLVSLFDKYGGDSTGLADVFAQVTQVVENDPPAYRGRDDTLPLRAELPPN